MPRAPLPSNEPQRLDRLRGLSLLDTPPDPRFDAITALAAEAVGAPIAVVSLVDEHRQWFKSTCGTSACETSRDVAFCAYAILSDEALVVPDATADERFADSTLVTGEPHIRAYAGVPLITDDGLPLGTLCAIDIKARPFTDTQLGQLRRLADLTMSAIDSHVRERRLRDLQAENDHLVKALRRDKLSLSLENERFQSEAQTHSRAYLELEKLTGQLPGMVYQYLLRPDGTSCFPYASEGIREVYDVAPADVAHDATPVIERLHPDELDDVMASITISAETLRPWVLEYRYRREDGTYRWLTGRATPERLADGGTLWHGFIHDVSEERETQTRLQLALRGGGLGLWDWNVRTGEVYLDRGWHEMLGYEPGELEPVLETWERLVHPEDLPNAWALAKRHFADPTQPYRAQSRYRTKDGGWKWIDSSGEVVERSPDGEPWRMVGVLVDVDETHRVVDELIDARASAEAASRAKTEFLANMSHEIRTPMTAILGYADLLDDLRLDPADRLEHAATIRRNGEHLLAILNDILDLSRIEAGKMQMEIMPVKPAEVISAVAELMRVRFEEQGVALELDLPDRGLCVRTDPTKLRQILMNLVGNAAKFTKKGRVTLLMRGADAADGRTDLRIEVEDTGIGIAADQLGTLFEAFTQTDTSHSRRFGGTGLGLSICHRLTDLMGGTIEAESQVGQGSTFRVVLRGVEVVTSQDPEASPASEQNRADASLSGKRILLAEDSPDNQRLVAFHLKKAGAEVVVVDNGRDAVREAEAALKDGRPFDVILMDVQMPELDGNAATWRLRRTGYDRPIITLSAHAMADEQNKAFTSGSDGYLTKPIDKDKLIAACATAQRRTMEFYAKAI